MRARANICIHLNMRACVCVHSCVCVCVCVCACMYICVFACVRVSVCECILTSTPRLRTSALVLHIVVMCCSVWRSSYTPT